MPAPPPPQHPFDQIHGVETSGLIVRIPNWWKAERPPRPQVSVRVGGQPVATLGANALLDFSRVEAGRIQAVYQPTDLASLTHDLASSFRSACEKAGLRLIVECAALT